MADENGVLKHLLTSELSSINQGIITSRRSLAELLRKPVVEERGSIVEIDRRILEEVKNKLSFSSSEVFFPITVYLSAGTDEGYITGEKEAQVADELGAEGVMRAGKYWVQKYRARSLSQRYPGLFQIFYLV